MENKMDKKEFLKILENWATSVVNPQKVGIMNSANEEIQKTMGDGLRLLAMLGFCIIQ